MSSTSVTHSWPIPTPSRGIPVVKDEQRRRPGRHRKPRTPLLQRTPMLRRAVRAMAIVEKPEARP